MSRHRRNIVLTDFDYARGRQALRSSTAAPQSSVPQIDADAIYAARRAAVDSAPAATPGGAPEAPKTSIARIDADAIYSARAAVVRGDQR